MHGNCLTKIEKASGKNLWYETKLRRMMTGWSFPDRDQLKNYNMSLEGYEKLEKIINNNLDAKKMVSKLKEIDAEVFYFHAKSHSGNAWYNTRIGHKHSALRGRDFVAELVRECRKNDISPVCMLQVTTDVRVYDEHSKYRKVSNKGISFRPYVCINNPSWRKKVLSQIEEIVANYDIDGILLDEFDFSHFNVKDIMCYCLHCQKMFRAKYGSDIPKEPAWDSSLWKHFVLWRYEVVADFLREVRKLIKKIKPKVSLSLISYAHSWTNWSLGQATELCAQHLDYLCVDTHGCLNLSQTARFFRAFSKGKPELIIWGTSNFGGVRDRMLIKPYPEYMTEAMTIIANGLSLGIDICYQPIHEKGIWDSNIMKMSSNIMKEIGKREKYLSNDMIPLSDTALYYSENSRDFYAKDTPQKYFNSYMGTYKALLEKQVLFDIIGDRHLNQKTLKKYKAIILPSAVCLSNTQIENITTYVENGGGLVATYKTSLCNEMGNKQGNFGLSKLFGVDYKSEGSRGDYKLFGKDNTSEHWYLKMESNCHISKYLEQICVLRTPTTIVKALDGTKVMGEFCQGKAVDICGGMMISPFIGNVTIHPAVVANKVGKGRVVYIAAKLGSLYGTTGHPYAQALLVNALNWATKGVKEVKVNAPRGIEVTAFKQMNGKKIIVHLVNLQSVPLRVTNYRDNSSVQDILPIHSIEMKIQIEKCRRVKSVYLVPGKTKIDYKFCNKNTIELIVPEVKIHIMVIIELI
ncbi:beta-galactosidase trimerization domain-containing protein [bacterium]|nr:beta-galactosidase trimerization domain-containing protein [bacterium]